MKRMHDKKNPADSTSTILFMAAPFVYMIVKKTRFYYSRFIVSVNPDTATVFARSPSTWLRINSNQLTTVDEKK